MIKFGPGLLEDDSDMPLATLAAVKEASSPSRAEELDKELDEYLRARVIVHEQNIVTYSLGL